MGPSDSPPVEPQSVDSLGGCLLSLLSSIGGITLLFGLALIILRRPAWTLTPVDALFWLVALAVAAAVHWQHRKHTTTSHRPVAIRLLLAAMLWLIAQSLQLVA